MDKLRALPYTEVHGIRANCGHPQVVPVRTTVRAACWKCIHGLTIPHVYEAPATASFSFHPALPVMPLASKRLNKSLDYLPDLPSLPTIQ